MSVLTPKGLVTAVLASIPLQLGLPFGDKIMDLGFAVVLLSIIICSALVIILSNNPLFFKNIKEKTTQEIKQKIGKGSKEEGDSGSMP
jgi:NhaP-type Na+/H+ or K+/H+ antiporter